MKMSTSADSLVGLIRRAIDSDVIDGWAQQGPYLVFLHGTARYYVRRQEAETFIDRLLHGRKPVELAVA